MNPILLIASIVCFLIVAAMGFDLIGAAHVFGWLGAGLGLFAAASLPVGNWSRL